MLGLGPYLDLLARHRQIPAFGFATALGSSFGQTFFIGVFSPSIQTEFGLSHTGWSSIYLLGTLASAAVLPWTGKQIDRLSLLLYAGLVWGAMCIACLAFSLATAPLGLVLGIFLLRQSGQGLMSHVALTSMARYFDRARGRAVAIASLGFAVGEACLPLLAVLAVGWVGWRWSYRGAALVLLLAMGPVLMLLARGHRHQSAQPFGSPAAAGARPVVPARSWTRREVLRDPRFHLVVPGLLCPSVVITAMFFHHLHLADLKGWSHEWITGCYVVFAAAATLTSLVAGHLIDRYRALRVVPAMLVPQAIGLLFVAALDSPLAVLPYMTLMGITTGISHTAVVALWAELYGVAHIGSIRSMAASLSVFGSALGPVTMGMLMDAGLSAERVCLLFAAYCAAGTVLFYIALIRTKRGQTPL